MIDKKGIDNNESSLLLRFNSRDDSALAELYSLYYDELIYFATKLFRDYNIEACDIIHDVFLKLWMSDNVKFRDLKNIKAYIYVSIRNNFYDYISHNKCVDKYSEVSKSDKSNFISEIIESETLSIINRATELLPKETSEIFKMIVDGWNVKDISASLGYSKSYVYLKKDEAIQILKKKLFNGNLYIILLLTNI